MSAEDSSSKDSAVIDDDLVEALGFEPTSTRDDISVVDDDDETEDLDDSSPERPPVARPFDVDSSEDLSELVDADADVAGASGDDAGEAGAAFGDDVEFVDIAQTDFLDDLPEIDDQPEIEPAPELTTTSYFDDLELVNLDDPDDLHDYDSAADDFDADEMAEAFETGEGVENENDERLDFDDDVDDDLLDVDDVRADDLAPVGLADPDSTIDLTTVDLTDDDQDREAAFGWADDDEAVNATAAVATTAALPTRSGRKTKQIRARKARRVIRHVDPWSTLTFSILFHLCFFAAMLLSSVLVWNAAQSAGIIDNLESFIIELGDYDTFDIDGDAMFRAALLISGILTLASTVMVVLLTVVFNLISDLVGGIRVTVIEEETVRIPAGSKK